MKLHEIQGLTYAQFKKRLKEIENCLNYLFKNKTISFDELYWRLNFALYGMDINYDDYRDLLSEEGKLIFSKFQNFFFDKYHQCFVIIIQYAKINKNVSDIKIRLLT
ncbi:hypothetical protein [Clostridium saccharoperbutylacetonicum]|uniref:hypothetical protein n=1 Tax=Clostridium saccharoperbutylacetonicum TaxID=36745 RepID=UPI0039EBD711